MLEGMLDFQFPDECSDVIKFDDTPFYRKYFNNLSQSKGVDFLALVENTILFIEVKDCFGTESDNRWRIFPDNKKRSTSPTTTDTTRRDSLDIEVSEKVSMTLACLAGATTKRNLSEKNSLDVAKKIISSLVKDPPPFVKVILFLEGNFASRSRTDKMIMKDLSDSIRKKLSWLECKVLVENLDTQKKRYFTVQRQTVKD